jgi:hypothetical protein
MKKNKKWVIVSLVATVLLLAIGLVGGATYAASGTTAGTIAGKSLEARVATILGIDQTKVEAAFTQAQKDMQNEALASQLKSMVDSGKMTQTQADQYKAWIQSKPVLPSESGLDGNFGFGGMRGPGGNPPAPPATAVK